MSNKSLPGHNDKKTGKSLKEKRADKKAKKEQKESQSSSEISVLRSHF